MLYETIGTTCFSSLVVKGLGLGGLGFRVRVSGLRLGFELFDMILFVCLSLSVSLLKLKLN